jgi:hypothetical protein
MLRYIIENRKEGSLGFYMVFLGGLRKLIFPEIVSAFQSFARNGDWSRIDEARVMGYKKAGEYATRLLELFQEKRNAASLSESIEGALLKDLLP